MRRSLEKKERKKIERNGWSEKTKKRKRERKKNYEERREKDIIYLWILLICAFRAQINFHF